MTQGLTMRNRFSLEHIFYFLAFFVALSVRLLNLGASPLADMEAQWAMRALEFGSDVTNVGAQPGYVMLTHLLFELLPNTNALARFLPVFLGSLIIFLPLLLRTAGTRLNFPKTAGIIFAFGLALDPNLTALSRQIGSPIPAIVCTSLAVAAIYTRRPIVAGIFGGLAVLSGPAVIQGLIALGIVYALIALLQKANWSALSRNVLSEELLSESPPDEQKDISQQQRLKEGIYAAATTILVTGTLLLAYPSGISGLAETITSLINGFSQAPLVPPSRLLAALLTYESLPMLFGLIGLVMAWFQSQRTEQFLSLCTIATLIVAIIYPARQVGDIAWTLVPLWGLAALTLANLLSITDEKSPHWVATIHALFLLFLMVIIRLNLLGWQKHNISLNIIISLTAAILTMGVIATALVAMGWSTKLALKGTIWGLLFGGILTSLASLFWSIEAHPHTRYELWNPNQITGQADLLKETLEQFSISETGLTNQINIVSTINTPSMHWLLRDFPKARFTPQLSINEQPSIVITYYEDELQSIESYRGQDFTWAISPGWQGALPPSWLNWFTFREAPTSEFNIILWVRADLLPGTSSISQP